MVNAKPGTLYTRKGPGTYCAGGWVSPRVRTDSENLASTGFDPRTVQPVGSCYTDYAIPAHDLITVLT